MSGTSRRMTGGELDGLCSAASLDQIPSFLSEFLHSSQEAHGPPPARDGNEGQLAANCSSSSRPTVPAVDLFYES